jgi:hypothetical protein
MITLLTGYELDRLIIASIGLLMPDEEEDYSAPGYMQYLEKEFEEKGLALITFTQYYHGQADYHRYYVGLSVKVRVGEQDKTHPGILEAMRAFRKASIGPVLSEEPRHFTFPENCPHCGDY